MNPPTVKDLLEMLKLFPLDATWWAYEGECQGIIIDHEKIKGIIHNSGAVTRNGVDFPPHWHDGRGHK